MPDEEKHMNFAELERDLDGLAESGQVPAYDCRIKIGQETVFARRRSCEADSLFWYYSATKVFTCTAACRLLERGLLELDAPVSRYIPEFAELYVEGRNGDRRRAEGELTLRHLFTMCGGLTYNIFAPEITESEDRSTLGIVRNIARMPLMADPGDMFIYSLCHDVLAAVVEVVSGRRFADFVRQEIAEPLGMREMVFHPEEEQTGRIAQQYRWKGEEGGPQPCENTNHFRFSPDYDSGGAGLCGRAEDYILLPQALACGGTGANGYQVLKPETVALMGTNQLNERQLRSFNIGWLRLRAYGYGLGVRTRMNHKDGGISSIGEFGWDGAAGAYCIIDPSRQLSAFYAQHVLDMGPVYDEIHPKIRDLIYQCLDS